MEVSPYPRATAMEGCPSGYSLDNLGAYSNHLGAYSNRPFFDEGGEFLELWKLALHSVEPHIMVDFLGSHLAENMVDAPPYYGSYAWPAQEHHQHQHQQHAHVFFQGNSPPGIHSCNHNVGVGTDATSFLFHLHGGDVYSRMYCPQVYGDNRRAGSPPHEAFFLVLQYLGLPELLCMEQVCRSLHGWIRSDTSLWRDLRVEHPLSGRLTDEALTRLSSRAQGYLRSLVLEDCLLVSNDGVHEVLVTNLMLSKLHLLWRSRVSADGLVKMIQRHNEIGGRKLSQLWIRGLHLTMSREQLRELREALENDQRGSSSPQFYDCCEFPVCKDERCMDVEACPRCENPRVVYDCTREKCREKQGPERCRACISCIARCRACGTCLEEVKYRESFNMELICFQCSHDMMASYPGEEGCELASTGMKEVWGVDYSFGRIRGEAGRG